MGAFEYTALDAKGREKKGVVEGEEIGQPLLGAHHLRALVEVEQGGGKFMRLPLDGVNATDEALYARADVLSGRADDMQVFVEELLRTWNDIAADPTIVGTLREQYGLLPDLPDDVIAEAVPYYTEAVENGIYPLDGGEPSDARDDMAFLSAAGQVEGDPDAVDPSAFWDFSALDAAKAAQ